MFRVVNSIASVVVLLLQLCLPLSTHAAEPTPTATGPVLPTSPLIITAYQAAVDGLNLIQIYNESDDLLSLDDMQVRYSRKSDITSVVSIPLSGLMLPNSHILIAATDVLVTSDRVVFRFMPSGWEPKALWLESPGYANVTIPTDMKTDDIVYKRSRTTTGYSTAASALNSPLVGGSIEADWLYQLPSSPALQIVEILPHAKDCSPFDDDVACGDYIKLQMLPGFDVASLADYRLKSGEGESITNTFSLLNASTHGEYLLLSQRDDGDDISLTNTGGYVWLEDAYGKTRYEQTLVQYPSASTENYSNQSWAFNDTNDVWQWGIPSPLGENLFPIITTEPTLDVCPTGKYRNPDTNRCRSLEEAVNELATCEEGKERNPATNRCRSIISTTMATLTPCDEGEERNVLTNRCRKVLAATSILASCDSGQERNPDTNRCRKTVSGDGQTLAAVKDVQSSHQSGGMKWWLAGGAVLLALAYAVYEWRYDIANVLKRK